MLKGENMKKGFIVFITILGIYCYMHSAFAEKNENSDSVEMQQAFEMWKKDFKKKALKAGIQEQTLNTYLPQMQLFSRAIKYDRKQPEFLSNFWQYMDNAIIPMRIQRGKEMLQVHNDMLQHIYDAYKIPPHYIVAFWGMESNFGKSKGAIPVLNALATMSFDARRRTFFTKQLMAYLRLLERGDIPLVTGSWAGTMGHFQFIPITLEAYGVDADGDGKINVVDSFSDAAFSAGNYLSSIGWHEGSRWGREVIMLRVLPWEKVYDGKAKTVRDWLKKANIQKELF